MPLYLPRGKPSQETETAWSRLVQRCTPQVIAALLARGIALHDAVELTQRAWTRLWEQQVSGKLTQFPSAQLAIAQARFLAIDTFRQSSAHPQAPLCDAEAVVDEQPSAGDRIASAQTIALLQRALTGCTPAERRIFETAMQSPGTGAEAIGHRLGLSAQRVRQVVCEVRRKLRKAMEDHHD